MKMTTDVARRRVESSTHAQRGCASRGDTVRRRRGAEQNLARSTQRRRRGRGRGRDEGSRGASKHGSRTQSRVESVRRVESSRRARRNADVASSFKASAESKLVERSDFGDPYVKSVSHEQSCMCMYDETMHSFIQTHARVTSDVYTRSE